MHNMENIIVIPDNLKHWMYISINDYFQGDMIPLKLFLDHMIENKHYTPERLIKFGVRSLKIPEDKIIDCFAMLGVLYFH